MKGAVLLLPIAILLIALTPESRQSCRLSAAELLSSISLEFRRVAGYKADLRFSAEGLPGVSQRAWTASECGRLITTVNLLELSTDCPDRIRETARHEACHVLLHGQILRIAEMSGLSEETKNKIEAEARQCEQETRQ